MVVLVFFTPCSVALAGFSAVLFSVDAVSRFALTASAVTSGLAEASVLIGLITGMTLRRGFNDFAMCVVGRRLCN